MFTAQDKIVSLSRKLRFWASCAENNNVDCFQTLNDFIIETECVLDENVCSEIVNHIRDLEANLVKYFPPVNEQNSWVRNPFKIKEKPANFSTKDYENFIEITSDSQLQQNFNELSLINFWKASLTKEYPTVAKRAINVVLPFATTYLCGNWILILCCNKNEIQKSTKRCTRYKNPAF